MAVELLWTVPVSGDGRRARRHEWNRGGWHPGLPASPPWLRDDRRGGPLDAFDHLTAVFRAGEHAGFDGLYVPWDPDGEDSWVVVAAAARATRWARTLVEFTPSGTTPVYAAKMSATLQRVSGGRLDWKLALDQSGAVAAATGDRLGAPDRYARASEFLTIARAVWEQRDVDFEGRFYGVSGGGLPSPLNDHRFPRVFVSGSAPEQLRLGARHADVQLLDVAPDPQFDRVAAEARRLAQGVGRSPRLGLSLPVVAREDAGEAWARVGRLLEERGTGSDADLHRLGLGTALWSGFDRLGFSNPVGLVGSYVEVATRLRAHVAAGIDVFVLDGYPHVEEAYRLGQHLRWRLDGDEAPAPAPAPAGMGPGRTRSGT